jgi:cellulose synthase/poly-beta-1,6-N-acetylglucosamine synthase-like glycosyltransferase
MIELGYWLVYLGIGLTLYVYIGYPLLLWVITNLYRKSHLQSNTFTEKVTLIVSCYNESDVIPDKGHLSTTTGYKPVA